MGLITQQGLNIELLNSNMPPKTKNITECNTQGTKSAVITGNETIWHIFLPDKMVM